MEKRGPSLCLIAIVMAAMVMAAGCETPGPAVNLPNGGTLSIAKSDPNAVYSLNGPPMTFVEDPLGSGIFTYKRLFKRFFVQNQGDSFQIQVGGNTYPDKIMGGVRLRGGKTIVIENGDTFEMQSGGRTIFISAPPPPQSPRAATQMPVFTQPLTRQLWQEAQASKWDITKMQLYISGTVVLEQELHVTELQPPRNAPVGEYAQGPSHLRGQAETGEIITRSTYSNTLRVLQTMTPGVALLTGPPEDTRFPTLEVSFENGPVGEPRFLRFVQDPVDTYGYFYLDYPNRTQITYGGKPYEIRYDEKSGKPPYLMIRTEFTASQDGNSLPGRRIQ